MTFNVNAPCNKRDALNNVNPGVLNLLVKFYLTSEGNLNLNYIAQKSCIDALII